MPWNIAIAAFGVTAAILLIGGAIVLRFARDRHHFLLMRAALEKGAPAFPEIIPPWLVSMRVGALTLALGAGVLISGIIVCEPIQITSNPPLLPNPNQVPAATFPPAPPPPGVMERLNREQAQHLIGLIAICVGGILTLLGIVRITFARIERRYAVESGSSASVV
jgi:hypothetical protein